MQLRSAHVLSFLSLLYRLHQEQRSTRKRIESGIRTKQDYGKSGTKNVSASEALDLLVSAFGTVFNERAASIVLALPQ